MCIKCVSLALVQEIPNLILLFLGEREHRNYKFISLNIKNISKLFIGKREEKIAR